MGGGGPGGIMALRWSVITSAPASALDGTYLLKTDRQDLADDEIWHLYILLTRVEAAFRALKESPDGTPDLPPPRASRADPHLPLRASWATLWEQLSTHQVATVVLPATDGRILKIRKASTPADEHREIYRILHIPHEPMKPVKTWSTSR